MSFLPQADSDDEGAEEDSESLEEVLQAADAAGLLAYAPNQGVAWGEHAWKHTPPSVAPAPLSLGRRKLAAASGGASMEIDSAGRMKQVYESPSLVEVPVSAVRPLTVSLEEMQAMLNAGALSFQPVLAESSSNQHSTASVKAHVASALSAEAAAGAETSSMEMGRQTGHQTMMRLRSVVNQLVGTLSVGNPPQELNVVFDTGSANVWVASTSCHSPACLQHRRYNASASTTFKANEVVEGVHVKFGTGELYGRNVADTVRLGPLRADDMTVRAIEIEEGKVWETIRGFEGLCGLAFPAMAAVGSTGGLMDAFIRQNSMGKNQGGHNLFAFYFNTWDGPTGANALSFGGVDRRFFEGNLQFAPISDPWYWTVDCASMYVGNAKVAEDMRVVFDTGTTLLTMEDELHQAFRDIMLAGWHKNNTLPTITYNIVGEGGKVVPISITPDMYVVKIKKEGKSVGVPGVLKLSLPPPHGPVAILGQVFFRHFYSVFDRQDGRTARVGWAKAKHSESNNVALMSAPGGSKFSDDK